MKIKVISGVILDGKPRVAGDILDVPAGKAYEAIALGRAVPYVEDVEPVGEVEDEDEKPKRRGRPRKS
jgi:hypothetical protein